MGQTARNVEAVQQSAKAAIDAMTKAGADQAEAWASTSVMTELYYEGGKISMVRTVHQESMSLKAIQKQRMGKARITGLDPVVIKKTAGDTLDSAKTAPEDPAEGVAEKVENGEVYTGPQTPDLDAMYTQMENLVKEVKQRYPKVVLDGFGVQHTATSQHYASTLGASLTETAGVYEASSMLMARDGEKVSSFSGFDVAYPDPAKALLEMDTVERNMREIEEQIETKPVDGSFTGELLVSPRCLGNILWSPHANFLSDSAHIMGTSLWKDKLGQQVADSRLNWRADPYDPSIVTGERITADGYPSKTLVIIEKGVLKNFALSRYGAAKTGQKRSGNTAMDFVVDPGTSALADMIKSMKRGLIMHRFSGAEPGPNGDMTGVAKNSYYVAKGKVAFPVDETMISLNVTDLFKSIVAISAEVERGGYSSLPWVLFKDVVISGK